ncbi:sugar O-acyltransferase, sialic acid O-acetyltransferase NeuD family [Thermoanaerobacterium xylanolyticum LX-11]|uniref:Sugar O-acyltransferase, sialic acid O-acetyltransferase NeuD family n=1 Tax=Thermoanaerobacterium xylanolyticum (strain ATCC 49914 / DSM 7097 / LX-11) TaxID=858215 RepID=F6BJ77_THEXL|nr:acetyltransferase [Thermoanaerobacterium xylanolyticum]AEF17894.1 sugar O-acyltransferase, sialic acid O-acetyltransferase NeuD family [Thermoanaerobacterium xylanolyticum LX-11]
MDKLVLIGAGGHAKAVIDILKKNNTIHIEGLIGKSDEIGRKVLGVPVIATDEQLNDLLKREINYALIVVGSVGDNYLRKSLYEKVKEIGFTFINAFHPSAIISEYVKFGLGNVVMAGTFIGPDTQVGNNVIVNTGSIIEHDCIISDHVHVAPGVKIAGGVKIGEASHIGIGSIIIQGIKIGKNSLIGAGTVVINDVPDNAVVVGVPGTVKKYRYDIGRNQ